MSHVSIAVRSAGGDYPVLLGRGLLAALPRLLPDLAPAFRYAVVSDGNVAPLYGEPVTEACRAAGLQADLFVFPAGEANKTRKQWSILIDALLAAGVGRDAAVVAVGGGVTGDLAGFVAATLHRGIPVVQVPTSLVAMIDASVGGKTGVDVAAGKNLVGAFHPPRAVVADPQTIATLPRSERAQGLAEAVKHGAIADAAYLEWLAQHADTLLDGAVEDIHEAVRRSVEIKAEVVGRDEREGGFREILNFGHTLGHALEGASGYAVGHGGAVAWGMVLEAVLGEILGITEEGSADKLRNVLAPLGLGGLPSGASRDVDRVMSFLGADKKARAGVARYVLLERPGAVASEDGWSRPAPEETVREILEAALGDAS